MLWQNCTNGFSGVNLVYGFYFALYEVWNTNIVPICFQVIDIDVKFDDKVINSNRRISRKMSMMAGSEFPLTPMMRRPSFAINTPETPINRSRRLSSTKSPLERQMSIKIGTSDTAEIYGRLFDPSGYIKRLGYSVAPDGSTSNISAMFNHVRDHVVGRRFWYFAFFLLLSASGAFFLFTVTSSSMYGAANREGDVFGLDEIGVIAMFGMICIHHGVYLI